jgi:hypothetical protein
MSVRQSFDHRLNDWLDEGPQVAPYDLLLAVLEELPSHHQERRWLFGGKWRIPMNAFARLGLVAAAVIAAVVVGAVAISGMRSGPSIGNDSTPTPSASSIFTSRLYPYSISVPAGWTATWAAARWDGSGAPDRQDLTVDVMVSPGTAVALGQSAPTTKGLSKYVADAIVANYQVHRATCPEQPESVEPVTIGGEPGKLLAWNCGIMVNQAFTVHAGQAYRFTFVDEAVHAATNPADKATFIALLASVQFK